MIINNTNCQFSNSQIGEENFMSNKELEIDWNEWEQICNKLKHEYKNKEEFKIISEIDTKIKQKDEKGLKNLIKRNYEKIFVNVLSGILSTGTSNFIEMILKK